MQKIINNILQLRLWNTLDIQFAKMLSNSIDNENKKNALILASAILSANIRTGHVCLPLYSLIPQKLFQGKHPELTNTLYKNIGCLSIDNWQELLSSCAAVSDGSKNTPLVLENKKLYLHRMWKEECTVAKFFRCSYQPFSFPKKKIINILNQLFPINYIEIDWYKVATAIGITHPRTIISGGPGTGKTTTITKIIATFSLLHNKQLQIKIAAPTGKAAAHLTESVNTTLNNIAQLNNHFESFAPKKATTLHNLLKKHSYYYKSDQNNCLNIDILIIDESSMVSLTILSQLITVIPLQTKVIFFGDPHQLCSIEPGSIFKDMCKFSNFHYSNHRIQEIMELTGYILPISSNTITTKERNHIIDGTCVLRKNHRFTENSGINKLAAAIKLGDYTTALSLLNSNVYTDLFYFVLTEKKDYINMIKNCAKAYYNYFQCIQYVTKLTENILKTFNHYRVLCALRDGPFGVVQINHYIECILHQKGLISLSNSSANYIGRPIIILKNDPTLGLSNGDNGILWPNKHNKLSAYFLFPNNKIKILQIYQLPKYETCFAMTIHKAQGSEFRDVSIILTNQIQTILTRELLYTAVTRSCRNLFLYATNKILVHSITAVTKRYSGLFEKLNHNLLL